MMTEGGLGARLGWHVANTLVNYPARYRSRAIVYITTVSILPFEPYWEVTLCCTQYVGR
jgi:hypothetical protein